MANTGTQPDEPVLGHLEDALERIEDPEARYHVRQAMQILAGSGDR